jgi:hypothetical protein
LLLRGVFATIDLRLAEQPNSASIHPEQPNRCTTSRCPSVDPQSVLRPAEVIIPTIRPWVKQRHKDLGARVEPLDPIPFKGVANRAGPHQIAEVRGPTLRSRAKVVALEPRPTHFLGKTAVFAPIGGPASDPCTELGGDSC